MNWPLVNYMVDLEENSRDNGVQIVIQYFRLLDLANIASLITAALHKRAQYEQFVSLA